MCSSKTENEDRNNGVIIINDFDVFDETQYRN